MPNAPLSFAFKVSSPTRPRNTRGFFLSGVSEQVEIGMPREALLVTYEEDADPEVVRYTLENMLRHGLLEAVGLAGSNVQVWRTKDLSRGLDPRQRDPSR